MQSGIATISCIMLKEKDEIAYLDPPIVSRKAFCKAAAQGRAVTELNPSDTKAKRELTALYEAIFGAKGA